MPCILPKMDVPQVLVTDFAPTRSAYEKVLKKLNEFFLVPAFKSERNRKEMQLSSCFMM
jgi:hypothetical protein